ncbi:hypothetical protein R3P38DRAFT_2588703, partial [Favolaschia claudopus]
RKCSNCGKTVAAAWRRDPSTNETLCNACGLFLIQRGVHRPPSMDDPKRKDKKCMHCGEQRKTVYFRFKTFLRLCNACMLLVRLDDGERVRPRKRRQRRGELSPE